MGFNGNITSIFSTKLTNHNYFFDASDNGYLPEWQRFIGKTMIDQLFLGQFGADCQALCGSATWTLGTCLRLMWQLKRRRFDFSAMITDMEILFSRSYEFWPFVGHHMINLLPFLGWRWTKCVRSLAAFWIDVLSRREQNLRQHRESCMLCLCCFSLGTPLWLARWLKLFTSWSVFQNAWVCVKVLNCKIPTLIIIVCPKTGYPIFLDKHICWSAKADAQKAVSGLWQALASFLPWGGWGAKMFAQSL